MAIYTKLHHDALNNDYWVEIGDKRGGCKDVGVAGSGGTEVAALRESARALERESKKLFKQAEQI